MEDFVSIIKYVLKLFSLEVPLLGYRLSISSIIISTFFLGLFIRVIVYIFKGDD